MLDSKTTLLIFMNNIFVLEKDTKRQPLDLTMRINIVKELSKAPKVFPLLAYQGGLNPRPHTATKTPTGGVIESWFWCLFSYIYYIDDAFIAC